jgi:ATP-dependent RNA helicase SUPV3L1/SUV3
LRKHGIRFGQFTVFMPPLLKPAPTRLRLVLWSLAMGLDEFPESPPPGVVTVQAAKDVPNGYFAMSGYRAAGERAIRIDMLERLADMLRDKDSRGGFEANPDMLSITGLTLEQFAQLMGGLGYKAEKGEREKVKPAAAPKTEAATDAADKSESTDAEGAPAQAAENADVAVTAETPEAEAPKAEAPETAEAEAVAPLEEATGADEASASEAPAPEVMESVAEMEVFYTFTWAPRAPRRDRAPQGRRPEGGKRGKEATGDAPKGKGPRGKPKGKGNRTRDEAQGGRNKPQQFEARPRKDKPIDPDNPFAAALSGFKPK